MYVYSLFIVTECSILVSSVFCLVCIVTTAGLSLLSSPCLMTLEKVFTYSCLSIAGLRAKEKEMSAFTMFNDGMWEVY